LAAAREAFVFFISPTSACHPAGTARFDQVGDAPLQPEDAAKPPSAPNRR